MTVANYYTFSEDFTYFEGGFAIPASSLANSVPVGTLIKSDVAEILTIAADSYTVANWRAYIRAVDIDEEVVPVFGGAIPRYKLGGYTPFNADFYYPITFLNYVQQLTDLYTCIFGTPPFPTEIVVLTPTLNSDLATIIGVTNPGSAFIYNYATDVVIDPAAGVSLDAFISYSGTYQGSVLNSGSDTLVLYNS